jgi:hypothetical protein
MSHDAIVSKDDEGNTALHYMVIHQEEFGHAIMEMMITLIKCGIDINAQNNQGKTVLHLFTKFSVDTFNLYVLYHDYLGYLLL